MAVSISVIIPNYNGATTIGACLASVFSSEFSPSEVTVVDDCSADGSVDVIRRFPCRLVKLDSRSGASRARNTGAANSTGEALFFIDSDCVLNAETLSRVAEAYLERKDCIIGGSYTPVAYDDTFFSTFQSVFINYSELKRDEPDYIAGHAMVISRELFQKSGGFPEEFMPIIEDVEFSHRLRRSGVRLIRDGDILIRHIFGFGLKKSLQNAFKKSKYWTAYSLANKDLLNDSGTASVELKFAVFSACLIWLFLIAGLISFDAFFPASATITLIFSIAVSSNLVRAFFRVKGASFGIRALLYFFLFYPLAVAAGGVSGILYHMRRERAL
jgi:GT2 family glycosyltransferase